MMSGKGSGRRPTNEEQYMNNWDAIFGKNKEQKKEKEENELSEQTKNPDQ